MGRGRTRSRGSGFHQALAGKPALHDGTLRRTLDELHRLAGLVVVPELDADLHQLDPELVVGLAPLQGTMKSGITPRRRLLGVRSRMIVSGQHGVSFLVQLSAP
jgi:hypothetical protein